MSGDEYCGLLSTYDPIVAMRVYGEEVVEEIAVRLLHEGDSVEKVARVTKLSIETVKKLQTSLDVDGDLQHTCQMRCDFMGSMAGKIWMADDFDAPLE